MTDAAQPKGLPNETGSIPMNRPTIAVHLPSGEHARVAPELESAGFRPVYVSRPADLEALLLDRRDVAVAIIDGESDFDTSLGFYAVLHASERSIPALLVVSPRQLDRFEGAPARATVDDELITRPYSAESLRWRVEAMCIRSQTVDDGSGQVLQSGAIDTSTWGRRAQVIVAFNPKGGVGKTTLATNLAVTLQVHHRQRVLLIDADTVTGHVVSSLGLEHLRTLADAWHDEASGAPAESLMEVAGTHANGLRVLALTDSPLHTQMLEPSRVAAAIMQARSTFDTIVVDLHPSYSELNLSIFGTADRIVAPVTPDIPALRAAVQLKEVAIELGVDDRLAMVVNRANSGVSVQDMESTVGLPALATIRSGGLLFVRAANEGKTVVELYPREKVTADFEALARRLVPDADAAAPVKTVGLKLFRRETSAT
jgi:pilus assembly protein CpaE